MPLPESFHVEQSSATGACICNRYRILEIIGIGTYGTVYRVEDNKTNSTKALKEVKTTGVDSKQFGDVLQESRTLASLSHKNIVQLLDAFCESSNFYLVMEFCSSGTLYDKISEAQESLKRFNHDQTVDWIRQLAEALAYIHQRRIIHRDLKTKNIFMSPGSDMKPWPSLKIGDFGISRTLIGSTDQASTCVGTPYYFSPEVFKQNLYNQKADIWAVGCILYELCCLCHPFTPVDNFPQLMYRVVTKEPDYSKWKGRSELKTLCTQMLEKDPKQRLSADQVLQHESVQQ